MEVEEAAVYICPEGLSFGTAVDICQERMDAADAEAPRMQAVEDTCLERMPLAAFYRF